MRGPSNQTHYPNVALRKVQNALWSLNLILFTKPLVSDAYATLNKAQIFVIFYIVYYVTFDMGGYVTQLCQIINPL